MGGCKSEHQGQFISDDLANKAPKMLSGTPTGDIQLDVERGHQQEAGGDHGPDGQSRA